MSSETIRLEPESLNSVKLKLFFKHLSNAAKKAEKKQKAKQAVDVQISKLKEITTQPGELNKQELSRSIKRLEQKMNELVELQKTKTKKTINTKIIDDVFEKINSLSVKLNAIGGLIEKKKEKPAEIDIQRVYELEQKIAKKLDKMLLKP